jgi:hypothetical protein
MWPDENQLTFRSNMSHPSSVPKNKQSKKTAGSVHQVMMEATCSSETSVDRQRTTMCYVQKIVLFIASAVRTTDPT